MSFAQPANDNCSGAITIALNTAVSYNTSNATNSGILANGDELYNDVWYKITAANTGKYVISTCGSTFDTKLAVYSATTCALVTNESHISYNDDDNSCTTNDLNSRVGFSCTSGTTYYIRIGGYDQSEFGSGTVKITFSIPPPPLSNDICSNSTLVTIKTPSQTCTPTVYSNEGSTVSEAYTMSCVGEAPNSVWFKFTTNANQNELKVTLNTITASDIGGDFFTDCNGTEAIGLSLQCFGGSGNMYRIISGFSPNTTYYFRVGNFEDFGSNTGEFELCIQEYIAPPVPVNDLCAGALVLYYDIPYSFNTESATTDNITTLGGGDLIYHDVWFSFTAPYNVMYDVTSCGSDYDTQIAVYQANDCSTIVDNSDIVYDDDDVNCATNSSNSFAQFNGTAGTKYYVRVGGYGDGDFGPSSILITNPNSGIDELSKVSFELTPNPASGNVSLTFDNNDVKTITVVDLTGKVVQVREISATQVSLDVSNFEKGMYLVTVSSEKGEGVKRLMKE